jgi:hypothetical protein
MRNCIKFPDAALLVSSLPSLRRDGTRNVFFTNASLNGSVLRPANAQATRPGRKQH